MEIEKHKWCAIVYKGFNPRPHLGDATPDPPQFFLAAHYIFFAIDV